MYVSHRPPAGCLALAGLGVAKTPPVMYDACILSFYRVVADGAREVNCKCMLCHALQCCAMLCHVVFFVNEQEYTYKRDWI